MKAFMLPLIVLISSLFHVCAKKYKVSLTFQRQVENDFVAPDQRKLLIEFEMVSNEKDPTQLFLDIMQQGRGRDKLGSNVVPYGPHCEVVPFDWYTIKIQNCQKKPLARAVLDRYIIPEGIPNPNSDEGGVILAYVRDYRDGKLLSDELVLVTASHIDPNLHYPIGKCLGAVYHNNFLTAAIEAMDATPQTLGFSVTSVAP